MAAFFFGFFVVVMLLTLQTVFTSYLLEDSYDVAEDDTGKVAGNLGFVAEIATLSTEFCIGFAMDLFGRKVLCVIGLLMAGLATASQPLPS